LFEDHKIKMQIQNFKIKLWIKNLKIKMHIQNFKIKLWIQNFKIKMQIQNFKIKLWIQNSKVTTLLTFEPAPHFYETRSYEIKTSNFKIKR